jgi:hypothetical protein
MTWLLLLGVGAFALAVHLARRRRKLFAVLRTDPVLTIRRDMSKKQSAKTRAALEAATAALR